MGELINHNSVLVFGAVLLGAAAAYLGRGGFAQRDYIVLAALLVLVVAGYAMARPAQASTDPVETVRTQIGQGTPVLFELQSPY